MRHDTNLQTYEPARRDYVETSMTSARGTTLPKDNFALLLAAKV